MAARFPALLASQWAVAQKRLGLSRTLHWAWGSASAFAKIRDFAWCEGDKYLITLVFARKITRASRARQLGIVRHEISHALDLLLSPKGFRALMHKDRSAWSGPEARADALAARIFGSPIRYDRDGVQTIGAGGRRPQNLPR